MDNPTPTLEKIVSPPSDGRELDLLSINTIRTLAADAVQKANSGHPGAPMGLAPAAYVLWHRFLKHNPANPHWPDRDRFVLSAGHASMLIYSLLYLTGYGLTIEELQQFRQWGSRTPGHPEYGHTLGVETTTAPLGQGFATRVGMASAERELAPRHNKPGFTAVDHPPHAICSAAAKADPRPSVIVLRTHIGYGAPTRQDTALAHGQALGADEVRGAKIRLGWDPDKFFFVPDEAFENWRQAGPKGADLEAAWKDL